jgi:hypothetical protein
MYVIDKQVVDTIQRLLEAMKSTTHKGRKVISVGDEGDVPIGFFSVFFFKTQKGDCTSYSTQLGIIYPDGIIEDLTNRVKQNPVNNTIIA